MNMKQKVGTGSVLVIIAIMLSVSVFGKERKNEKTLVFTVNMDCHACVQKIEGNIPYEKGVKDLKISLDDKTCEITFRTDKTSPEALVKAFGKIGYKAELKTDQPEEKKDNNEDHEGHIHQ